MTDVNEIYKLMAEDFKSKTGILLASGSDMSVRLWALATQISALYANADWIMSQTFAQSANGEMLDLHAACRGLERREAAKSGGIIRFERNESAPEDIIIPAGTVCSAYGDVRYETCGEAVLSAGELSVSAAACALEGGTGGNAAAGAITVLVTPPAGINSCTNPLPFTGGSDIETDDELKSRITASYKSVSNGANAAYYVNEAKKIPGVAGAVCVGRARGRGTVDLYISAADGVPPQSLLNEVASVIEQKREIAVDVSVLPPVVTPVAVSLELSVKAGYEREDVAVRVRSAVESCLGGRTLGQSLYRAKIISAVFEIDGVENAQLISPSSDIVISGGGLAVLSDIDVEVL